MGLIPVYFCFTDCAIRKLDEGDAFHFPPSPSAVNAFQMASDIHTSA